MDNNVFFQQLPGIKVRFANPMFDTKKLIYSVGAEFSSENPDYYVYDMNVRFMFDSSQLRFVGFDSFAPGYGKFSPNPPYVNVGTPPSGPIFGFNNPAVFVNGAVSLYEQSEASKQLLPVDGWFQLFRINFTLPTIPALSSFAPSIVWDKNGYAGFLFGEGVCITAVDSNNPKYSTPTRETCEPFNWEYNNPCALPLLGKPKPTQYNILFMT